MVLESGDVLDRHYKILKALAVGGAGITYLAREVDANGEPQPPDLAIKLLYTQRASGAFLRRLSNEAQILQDLAHDHIVQSRGFVHRSGHEPYLVTLFEHGGSLGEHIERVGALTPRVAAGIVRQILLALDVAHQRGVIHRDLKPDNVLLQEKLPADEIPHVRLTDFGIAKVTGGGGATKLTRMGAFVGTPEYAAPEQFEGLQPTSATDVFAAGGVLWYCVTGHPPVDFTHRTDIEESYEELLAQLPPRVAGAAVRGEAKELALLQAVIDGAMHPKPEDRWSIHQILARLGELEGRPAPMTNVNTASPAPQRLGFNDPTLDTGGLATLGPRPAAMATFTAKSDGIHPPALTAPAISPPKAAPPAPTPAPAAPRRTESAALPNVRRAGVLGVGVATMGLTLVGGGVLVGALLAVAAWAFGWFGSTPVVHLDPITFG